MASLTCEWKNILCKLSAIKRDKCVKPLTLLEMFHFAPCSSSSSYCLGMYFSLYHFFICWNVNFILFLYMCIYLFIYFHLFIQSFLATVFVARSSSYLTSLSLCQYRSCFARGCIVIGIASYFKSGLKEHPKDFSSSGSFT